MDVDEEEIIDHLFLVCRLCIRKIGKFAIVPHTPIHNAIQNIFGVKIEPFDGMSQLLCSNCKEKLLEIQDLREAYIRNQATLHALKILHNSHQNTNSKENNISSIQCEIKSEAEATALNASCAEDGIIILSQTENNTNEILQSGTNTVDNFKQNNSSSVQCEIKSESEAEDVALNTSCAEDGFSILSQTENNTNEILQSGSKAVDNVEQTIATKILNEGKSTTLEQSPIENNCVPVCVDRNTDLLSLDSALDIERDPEQYKYQFYCRMCNESFKSMCFLKPHLKSHTNLIKLQRHFTPCGCNVKLTRLLHDNCDEATETGHYHALFYKKRKVEESFADITNFTNTLNDLDLDADDFEFEDNIDIEDDLNVDINLEAGFGIEGNSSLDNIEGLGSLDPVPSFVTNDGAPAGFGSTLTEIDTIHDNQDTKPDIIHIFNEEQLTEIIWPRVFKYYRNMANEELLQVEQILLQMCKKNMKINWKDTKSDSCPVINLYLSKRPVMNLLQCNNLSGYHIIKKKRKNAKTHSADIKSKNKLVLNKKKTITPSDTTNKKKKTDYVTLNKETNLESIISEKNTANSASANKDTTHIATLNLQLETQSTQLDEVPRGLQQESVKVCDEAIVATDTPICEKSESEAASTAGAVLPIIVSTTSLPPATAAAATDSTSAYIDLNDDSNTLFSKESPLKFLKLLLQNHSMDLSLENGHPEAVTLCCFKKNLDDKGPVVLSLFIDDSTFFLEVSVGKTRLNLENEQYLIQWRVLTSLTDQTIINLIKNYSKISPRCCDNVDKFIKIARSISGKVRGSCVFMAAPNKIFF